MKKYLLLALAAGLIGATFAGCGSDTPSNQSTPSILAPAPGSSDPAQSSEPSETGSGSSEAASSEASSAVSSDVSSDVSSAVSSAASSKPASSAASSKPASKPASSTPQSSKPVSSQAPSKPAASLTPQQVCKAIAGAYGKDYLPDGEMPREYIDSQFSVDPSLVESAYGEMSMISVNPDHVIVMKAPSGKGAQLESAMQKERDKYVETARIYPKDTAKLNASRVVRSGDYVAFIMLGAIDETNEDAESAAAQKFAQDQVAIGVRAFQNALK